MITQETNPVYWAYTHCLTLEPWTVIFTTFFLTIYFEKKIFFYFSKLSLKSMILK